MPDMESATPRLSILTPSFGYGRFIGQAIESCRSQGVDDYEHIVQDACSTDETDSVVSALSHSRLRYFREPDQGQSDGLNKAFARARGEWIGWLNADEYFLPGAFRTVLDVIDRHPDADIVYGDCLFVDVDGNPLRLLPSHPYSSFVLKTYGCYIQSCATFIRRSALEKVGWDPQFRRTMDWDLYLGLHNRKFLHFSTTIAAFRIHPDQVTASPESAWPEELAALRAKHHMPEGRTPRTMGRLAHAGLKLLSGAYGRQLIVAARRGRRARNPSLS